MPKMDRARLDAVANVSPNRRSEVYAFIRSLVNKALATDVFSKLVMKEINKDIYVETIDKVTKAKPPVKDIFKAYTKYSDLLHKERTKRYPSPDRALAYKTQLLAYGDVIEYMDTYHVLKNTEEGNHMITQVLT